MAGDDIASFGPLHPRPLPPPLPPPATPLADATRRTLITGGGGFLGFRLAVTLARDGVEVTILDLAPPRQPLPPRVRFIAGSVADAAAVDAAFVVAASPFPAALGDAQTHTHTHVYGLDAVFHVASYGMSGRELRDQAALIEAVNVGGSGHVAAACVRHAVPRLVYVSTCNVIFVGRPISGGDESAPYPPAAAYKDAYSATKARAERVVLAASGTPLLPEPIRQHTHEEEEEEEQKQEGQQESRRHGARAVLRTCAVRSTGIWGPGETRHQPRVIRMVQQGVFVAAFGDPNTLSDWCHVDNLVQILMLAERGLRTPCTPAAAGTTAAAVKDPGAAGRDGVKTVAAEPELENGHAADDGSACDASGTGGHGSGGARDMVAEGQVYYASDGAPINNFLHFKPFIVGLGYHYPSVSVPYGLVYGIAGAIEVAWPLLRAFVRDPPLTRMEVDKCCIEHWFRIDKARRELGFAPAEYDRQEVVAHMAAEGWAAPGSELARRHAAAAGGAGDDRGAGARAAVSVRWLVAGSVVAAATAVGVGYMWRG